MKMSKRSSLPTKSWMQATGISFEGGKSYDGQRRRRPYLPTPATCSRMWKKLNFRGVDIRLDRIRRHARNPGKKARPKKRMRKGQNPTNLPLNLLFLRYQFVFVSSAEF